MVHVTFIKYYLHSFIDLIKLPDMRYSGAGLNWLPTCLSTNICFTFHGVPVCLCVGNERNEFLMTKHKARGNDLPAAEY